MTDEQKAIRDYWYRQGKDDQHQMDVERIEAQAAEIERLREAIAGPEAWLDSWAQHVGKCQGGYVCTCGLVLARTELSAALKRELL